jgi:hypothetical protein
MDMLSKMLNRPVDELTSKLTVGPAEECAEKLRAYRDAGLQRVLIWPLGEAVKQLELFKARVEPLVGTPA